MADRDAPALRLEVGSEVRTVDPDGPVRIGRAAESDVLLVAPSVSRHHAELRPTTTGWELVDVGGQLGTFVDDVRVTVRPITGRVTVRCGPPGRASSFVAEPVDARGRTAPRATHPGLEVTGVLAVQPDAPGEARTGPALLVAAEGREHRFAHPRPVEVGRHPDSTLVLHDPLVSRRHGRVEGTADGWVYANLSDGGTFRDGRRVDQVRLRGPVRLRLGHPVAGTELVLTPVLSAAEEQRRLGRERRRRRMGWVAGVAAVAAVLGGVALAVGGGIALVERDEPRPSPAAAATPDRLTDAELDSAKRATVRLLAETTDTAGSPVRYTGSGTVVDPSGLILTNAHVAAPDEPGVVEAYGDAAALVAPDFLLVALVPSPDAAAAEPAYRARVVEADGVADAAVVEIYADADGAALTEPLDLPTLPVGDSGSLRTGDDVTVLGFPAISGSAAVTVTRGVISTFLDDPDLGPRSEIDTDARIAPGNSGGAAIDDDARIIGIPSALYVQQGTAVASGRIRPVDTVGGLLADAGVG